MKHKAQESLKSKCNKCEEMARITHRGGCAFRNIDNTRCKEYDTLQDLINCQLTVEEIDNLILSAKIVGVFKALNGEPLEKSEVFISLQKKLLKQKEMWVSEDVFK